MKRLLFGVTLASILSGIAVSAAPKTDGSIILNVPPSLSSPNLVSSWPRVGDNVTFTSTFPTSLDSRSVMISVICYQNGYPTFLVADRYDQPFNLGGTTSPMAANGGPAFCRAELYYWSKNNKQNVIASTEFDVVG